MSRPWALTSRIYPQALELTSGNLSSRLAGNLLLKWPTFADFQQAKPSTLRASITATMFAAPRCLSASGPGEKSQAQTTDEALVESGDR